MRSPSAGMSTPFLRHSWAPITPSSSRSETTEGTSPCAIGFGAGFLHVRRAAQGNAEIRLQRQQQHPQGAGALGLRLAMEIEGFERRRSGLARFAVDAARHGLQQLARILEVAPPQQRGALAGQAIGRIRGNAVVRDHHTLGRRRAALRAPAGRAGRIGFGPVHNRVMRVRHSRVGETSRQRVGMQKQMVPNERGGPDKRRLATQLSNQARLPDVQSPHATVFVPRRWVCGGLAPNLAACE